MEKKKKIALSRQRLLDANEDLKDTNDALHNLRTVMEDLRDEESREPKLEDYYEPSDKMKMYVDIVTGILGLGSGYLFTKFFL